MQATTPFHLPAALLAEQFRLQIPSVLDQIGPTVAFLKDRAVRSGAATRRASKLELALHEALTNSVVHGNLEIASKLKEDDSDAFARALAERGADPGITSRHRHHRRGLRRRIVSLVADRRRPGL